MQKNYFKKTILITIFLALFFSIFGIIAIVKFFPIQSNTYSLAHIDKIELLKKDTKNQRIILFGGSNVAFGFDSNLLEKTFSNYDVLNVGTVATLGMRFPLNEIKKYLKKGDLLLVFPEYGHYQDGGYGGGPVWEVFSYRRNIPNLELLTKIIPSIQSVITLQINAFSSKNLFDKTFTYDRRGFNSKGDYIAHHKFPMKKMPAAKFLVTNLDNSFYDYLKDYKNSLDQVGVKSYYFPPVYQKSSGDLSKDEIKKIYSKSELFFSNDFEKYFLDDDLFYDTLYHLNKEGSILRTNILIEDLKKII
ncbi:MAG: hypothetical protein ACRC5T_08665 [Cetobacterium sp.]